MITKTISRVGNSQGINLERTLLESLGLDVGSKVHVCISGRSIVLTPAEGSIPAEVFNDSLNEVNKKYSKLFKRLA